MFWVDNGIRYSMVGNRNSYAYEKQPPTFLRNAVGCFWILPRPNQQSTGLLITPAAPGPAFRILLSTP